MLNIRSGGFDHAQYSTVLLDIWWDMLIKFSKQIANSFAKIRNGYKGEQKACKTSEMKPSWMFGKVLTMLLNQPPKTRMFHFEINLNIKKVTNNLLLGKPKKSQPNRT